MGRGAWLGLGAIFVLMVLVGLQMNMDVWVALRGDGEGTAAVELKAEVAELTRHVAYLSSQLAGLPPPSCSKTAERALNIGVLLAWYPPQW